MNFRSLAVRNGVAIAATAFALSASAQPPSKAICAVQQAVVCASVNACERSLPAGANLPALLRFDIDAGTIESRRDDGEFRTSKIASSSTHEDALVLQGSDDGHPWAMRINTKSGLFTLSILREDEGFVGFGVCSAKILQ